MNLRFLSSNDWQSKDKETKITFQSLIGEPERYYSYKINEEEKEEFDIEFIIQETDCLEFYKDNELKLKITYLSPTSINFIDFGQKNIDLDLEICDCN